MKTNMLGSLRGLFAALSIAVSCSIAVPADAQDTIKVAVGQIDAWANQVPTLGMKAGIFQKHGIVLDNYGTQGAGETLQAVISGSADIGIGVGTPGAMRAFAKGAPEECRPNVLAGNRGWCNPNPYYVTGPKEPKRPRKRSARPQ